MNRWLLHNVRVLDEAGGFTEPVDVSVVDGIVAEVGANLRDADAEILGIYEGAWLMPGVFDCHSHITIGSVDTLAMMRTPVTQGRWGPPRSCGRPWRAG